MTSTKNNLVYVVPFLAGLLLQLMAIHLFRKTFIPQPVTLGLYFGAAVVGFILLRKKLGGMLFTHKILDGIVGFVWSLVSIGGILVWLLLAANYYGASKNVSIERWPALESGPLGKEQYILIERRHFRKELVFSTQLSQPIEAYKSVNLAISRGLFGFDIIREKQATEEVAFVANL